MDHDSIFIGGDGKGHAGRQDLLLRFGNRHGLIAGATGTGKTVSLQILAEGFSAAGVPVFLADVKSDLSGLAAAGSHEHKLHDKLVARAETIGFDDYGYDAFPVVFWDLFGEQGHPVRTTVTEMGPLLLSQLLGLNDTQEGVINIAFTIADDQGMLLLDLKDLRAILNHLGENAREISTTYGYVTRASIGAILRRLLVLEQQGGEAFFGEPALKLTDMIATTPAGQGRINILAAERLMQSPKLYATFLLWLLSELFEELPEVGDPDKPKFVFFFDEAHLLFDDAPKALIDKVEMVARLIRSKGVGVYFITQNPADVPDDILGQLGNRIQHALRAYTPRDRKALRAAAETFRQNPAFDAEEAILDLGTGEALVSTLRDKGAPSMVERTLIRPPSSRLGPLTEEERARVLRDSPLSGQYDETIDRVSAFEQLTGRVAEKLPDGGDGDLTLDFEQFNSARRYVPVTMPDSTGNGRRRTVPSRRAAPEPPGETSAPKRKGRSRQTVAEAAMKSFARSVSSRLGREIVRGVLGGMFRGR